jgi:hypothetical protein
MLFFKTRTTTKSGKTNDCIEESPNLFNFFITFIHIFMPYQGRMFSRYFGGLPTRTTKFFVLSNIQNTGFRKKKEIAFQNFKDPIQPELIRIQLGSRFSISCGFDHMLKKVSHSLFLPVYVFHRHFLYISILIINDDRATFKPTTNTIKF